MLQGATEDPVELQGHQKFDPARSALRQHADRDQAGRNLDGKAMEFESKYAARREGGGRLQHAIINVRAQKPDRYEFIRRV